MSKTLKVCKEIMKAIAERGFTNQITRKELEKVIMVLRGVDKRTINNWVKALERLGFIKPFNALIFELDFRQIPELYNVIIKEPNQKKLM